MWTAAPTVTFLVLQITFPVSGLQIQLEKVADGRKTKLDEGRGWMDKMVCGLCCSGVTEHKSSHVCVWYTASTDYRAVVVACSFQWTPVTKVTEVNMMVNINRELVSLLSTDPALASFLFLKLMRYISCKLHVLCLEYVKVFHPLIFQVFFLFQCRCTSL